MEKLEELKLLTKIARLYYQEYCNQQEIGNKLNISRTRVSRYLKKAKKEQIVQIKINSAWEIFEEIENKIEKKYSIKECIIVPSFGDKNEIYKQMAVSLTNLLDRILYEGDLLGVGWGNTLKSVVSYLEPSRTIRIKVVPLLGGLGKIGIEVHTNLIASAIAEKYGGESYVIHSPAVLDSKEAKLIMEKDSSVKEIFDMFGCIKTAIIGMSDIGADSTMIKTGNFNLEDFRYLLNLGVAGDVNLIFIDENGNPVANRLDDRILKVPVEKLKKIPNVIGISFGNEKVDVIKGALKGGIIDILITDELTAKELLENEL